MRGPGVYKQCGCVNQEDGRRWGRRCPRLTRRGHGCWYFTVDLPAGRDGGRRRLRRGGFATRVAAEQARAYWLGADVDPDLSLVTVGQWLDIWLETRQILRPTTRRIYARDYLKPRLGGVPLRDRDLTVGKVQAMFTALLWANEKRAHPLAPATFQRIREVLRAALNGAIRRGLITQNPARWVEVPSARRPQAVVWTDARVAVWRATGQRPVVAVWTAGQTAAFLAHVCGQVLYPLFHVAALLGLCRGEVIGLRWSDVDFAAGTQTVCRQVQERDGRAMVCLPKSERSGRMVALDHGILALLRRLHAEWEEVTGGVAADGWLFTHDDGAHWSPSYVTAHVPPADPRSRPATDPVPRPAARCGQPVPRRR
jgi:integrase